MLRCTEAVKTSLYDPRNGEPAVSLQSAAWSTRPVVDRIADELATPREGGQEVVTEIG